MTEEIDLDALEPIYAIEDNATTLEEEQAIAALQRLSRRWPRTLVIIPSGGQVTVVKRTGLRDVTHVATVDIEAYME